MPARKTQYFRKSSERSKSSKKRHGKQARFMEVNKDTTTNPHAKNKKASAANPHGKSKKWAGGRKPRTKKKRLGSRK